jgi:hypothetical protein
MVSCIRSEAPNAEADILSCTIGGKIALSNTLMTNNDVTLVFDPSVSPESLKSVPVYFTLTPGASVTPANGTEVDLSSGKEYDYVVTSENGKWTHNYKVRGLMALNLSKLSFDHFQTVPDNSTKKYHEFIELGNNEDTLKIWASGNAGFQLVAGNKTPEEYPTSFSPDGMSGGCAKLQTVSTGALGNMMKMPLAAGNLYIGEFKGMAGVSATRFGLTTAEIPTGFTGYYKYKAGETYMENNTPVADKKDNFDIYGIIYDTSKLPEDEKYLTGATALTSPALVAVARIDDAQKKETDEWTPFTVPFTFLPGQQIDKEKLFEGMYNLSIIFSSSVDGAQFNGAIGSTLYIDEVSFTY